MDKVYLNIKNVPEEFLMILSLLRKEKKKFDNINFFKLVDLSLEHRVFLIIYNDLKNIFSYDPEKIEYLKNIRKQLLNKLLKNLSTLVDIIRILEKLDINFLVLKGIVLSEILYKDLYVRGSIDIDILILNESKIFQLIKKFENYNYKIVDKKYLDNKFLRCLYLKVKNSIQLINRNYNIPLDLHYRLAGNRIFTAKRFQEFVNNRISKDFYGHDINIFSVEHYFLFLCIHSSIHCFKRLLWIYDVYKFIVEYKIDLLKVYKISCKYKVEKHYLNSLYVCNKLFDITDYGFNEIKKRSIVSESVLMRLYNILSQENSLKNKLYRFFYKILLAGDFLEIIDIVISYFLRSFLKLYE